MKHKKFISVILVILFFDQLVKFIIRSNFFVGSSIPIINGFFSLTYLQNTGVSFGLLKGFNWIFTFISVAALMLFVYSYTKEKENWLQYALISGGVAGNLIDRLYLGYVVDYINFHFFPVFNIADMSISIGIIWLIFTSFNSKTNIKKKKLGF
ncbi:MAG: signal peptidase II [Nanoarchaeota archaeon]